MTGNPLLCDGSGVSLEGAKRSAEGIRPDEDETPRGKPLVPFCRVERIAGSIPRFAKICWSVFKSFDFVVKRGRERLDASRRDREARPRGMKGAPTPGFEEGAGSCCICCCA